MSPTAALLSAHIMVLPLWVPETVVLALLTCPQAVLTQSKSQVRITEAVLKPVPMLPWAGILQQREGSYLALGAVSPSWWAWGGHCGCAQPALFKGSGKHGDGEVRKAEVGAQGFASYSCT